MINFTVGPVQSSESVCFVGAEQVPYFRTQEFSNIMLENERLIKKFANADEKARVVFITDSGTASMEAFKAIKRPFSNELLDEFTEVTFENGYYMAFSTYEDYLKNEFGDYMQLPPEEERTWVHHPLVIDFEKNIDELDKTIWKPQS